MGTGEYEIGQGMIERCRGPARGRRVTRGTGRGKRVGHMVGIDRRSIVGLMTGKTIGRSRTILVGVAGLALTLCREMGAGQRERCCRMVESRRLPPGSGRMTVFALIRKLSIQVIRINRGLKILQMTGHTLAARGREFMSSVARLTGLTAMGQREREAELSMVLDRRRGP